MGNASRSTPSRNAPAHVLLVQLAQRSRRRRPRLVLGVGVLDPPGGLTRLQPDRRGRDLVHGGAGTRDQPHQGDPRTSSTPNAVEFVTRPVSADATERASTQHRTVQLSTMDLIPRQIFATSSELTGSDRQIDDVDRAIVAALIADGRMSFSISPSSATSPARPPTPESTDCAGSARSPGSRRRSIQKRSATASRARVPQDPPARLAPGPRCNRRGSGGREPMICAGEYDLVATVRCADMAHFRDTLLVSSTPSRGWSGHRPPSCSTRCAGHSFRDGGPACLVTVLVLASARPTHPPLRPDGVGGSPRRRSKRPGGRRSRVRGRCPPGHCRVLARTGQTPRQAGRRSVPVHGRERGWSRACWVRPRRRRRRPRRTCPSVRRRWRFEIVVDDLIEGARECHQGDGLGRPRRDRHPELFGERAPPATRSATTSSARTGTRSAGRSSSERESSRRPRSSAGAWRSRRQRPRGCGVRRVARSRRVRSCA